MYQFKVVHFFALKYRLILLIFDQTQHFSGNIVIFQWRFISIFHLNFIGFIIVNSYNFENDIAIGRQIHLLPNLKLCHTAPTGICHAIGPDSTSYHQDKL